MYLLYLSFAQVITENGTSYSNEIFQRDIQAVKDMADKRTKHDKVPNKTEYEWKPSSKCQSPLHICPYLVAAW